MLRKLGQSRIALSFAIAVGARAIAVAATVPIAAEGTSGACAEWTISIEAPHAPAQAQTALRALPHVSFPAPLAAFA